MIVPATPIAPPPSQKKKYKKKSTKKKDSTINALKRGRE